MLLLPRTRPRSRSGLRAAPLNARETYRVPSRLTLRGGLQLVSLDVGERGGAGALVPSEAAR
jgi:hypothetical protein